MEVKFRIFIQGETAQKLYGNSYEKTEKFWFKIFRVRKLGLKQFFAKKFDKI